MKKGVHYRSTLKGRICQGWTWKCEQFVRKRELDAFAYPMQLANKKPFTMEHVRVWAMEEYKRLMALGNHTAFSYLRMAYYKNLEEVFKPLLMEGLIEIV